MKLKHFALAFALAFMAAALGFHDAQAQQEKPNILVIMGDDIGYWNISAYSQGMMGYRTPNIDRIAKEGALFTDFYGQQSCTEALLQEGVDGEMEVKEEYQGRLKYLDEIRDEAWQNHSQVVMAVLENEPGKLN